MNQNSSASLEAQTDDETLVTAEFSEEDSVLETGANAVREEIDAWKMQHLQQRLAYLEAHPPTPRQTVSGSMPADEEISNAAADLDDAGEMDTVADEVQSSGDIEQELARLRWRNRYLEGRLAYIDGDSPKTDAEIAAQSDGVSTVSVPANSDVSAAFEAQEGVKPSAAEAVLAAMENNIAESEQETAKPIMLERPENGGDDLTRITGIDSATAQSLNEAGIWHYYQIAGWSSENVDWVNTLLGAEARIQDQDWITQAGALSLGADTE